jgi:hypothetical protein
VLFVSTFTSIAVKTVFVNNFLKKIYEKKGN